MKIITRTLATTAALMLAGAAGAAATETSPADACVEAGNIWTGEFCFDREAGNGYECDGVLQYEPCTPEALPVVEPIETFEPAPVDPITPAPAPVEAVAQPVPAPVVYAEPAPRTELAYTGAKETAAVLAVLALASGGGLLFLSRRL